MCEIFNNLPIQNILTGDVVNQGENLSNILTEIQEASVPTKFTHLKYGSDMVRANVEEHC